jgi:hypothetical protein
VSKNKLLFYKISNKPYNGELDSNFINEFCDLLKQRNMREKSFIMDNLAVHKMMAIRSLIEQNGHEILFYLYITTKKSA